MRKDRELKFWAAVIFASNLSVIATCFSYVTFVAAIGMQFWLLAAVVHAVDHRIREETAAAARARLASSQAQAPGSSAGRSTSAARLSAGATAGPSSDGSSLTESALP